MMLLPDIERRTLLAGGLAAAAIAGPSLGHAKENDTMYGLIGQMKAAPGKRDELIAILSESTGAMPGCLSYIVAKDATDADALWITEVWTDKDSHAASLKLPPSRRPSPRPARSSPASVTGSRPCRWAAWVWRKPEKKRPADRSAGLVPRPRP
jgi:quinol monooxygenase YgiN